MTVCIYMCKCMSGGYVCGGNMGVCIHACKCVGYVCLAQATLLGSHPLREDQYCV